jgi:hypothetical protein
LNLNPTQQTIIRFLATQGGTGNVMEALGYDSSKFDDGFALALTLENNDLVKLLYSNFNKNLVVVEMTLLGFKAIEQNQT